MGHQSICASCHPLFSLLRRRQQRRLRHHIAGLGTDYQFKAVDGGGCAASPGVGRTTARVDHQGF